jgi:hypothetical protein
MATLFVRPIRSRIELTPEEKLDAFKNAAAQYRLGCVMVVLNLVFPFSGETFGYYVLPTIVMFALACAISLTRRLLWPRNAAEDELFAAGLVIFCFLAFTRRSDFVFSQRLLGDLEVPNVFAHLTLFHVAGLAVAAYLIPKEDCWSPLRVAGLLVGTCIVGAGMPGTEIAEHKHYVFYLGGAALILVNLANSDVAQCFRAWCASSPLTNTTGSRRILELSATTDCFVSPLFLLFGGSKFFAAVWRAQVLWLSGWPVPPESLDPTFVEFGHLPMLRQAGVRRLLAAVAQASVFAFLLVAYPPAVSPRPYLTFAAELLAPLLVQFVALALINGPFLLEAQDVSEKHL